MTSPSMTMLAATLALALSACDTPAIESTVAKSIDEEGPDCSKLVPGLQTFADPTGLVLGWEYREADLAFAVDQSFVDYWGDQWSAQALDLAALMDEFYRRETNLGIKVVQLVQLPLDVSLLPSSGVGTIDSRRIMKELIDAYNASWADTQRDSVQFLVGARVAGTIEGQANCIGGAGYPEVAYVWGEAHERGNIGLDEVGIYDDPAVKIAIHEFGHMMSAEHHYSNCLDGVVGFRPRDANGICGIMNNFADVAGIVFSSLNKLAVRAWAEQVDF